MKTLLKYGANIDATSHVFYHRDHASSNICSYDETPLCTAARLNCLNIATILIEYGADVNIQSECRPPQGFEKVKDRTALHFAAECGSIATVSHLVKHGAKVNIADKQQETPLHLAVRCKGRLCENQIEVVRLLLQYGSLPDLANKCAQVPLYLASFYGCVIKAGILIEGGADVNYSCSRENSIYVTALHVAAAKNRVHLAKLLIENNADLNVTNALNYTPLQLNLHTLNRSSIAVMLITHGAHLELVDYNGLTLMATLIHNMRLDCEILARLLVFAGYSLNHDVWILAEHQRLKWRTDSMIQDESICSESCRCTRVKTSDVKIPYISIPHGRVEQLCDWLRERQTNSASLTELSRISIRFHLSHHVTSGSSIVQNIQKLPLPCSVREYLLLKDVIDACD